jgi:hypothetical protein
VSEQRQESQKSTWSTLADDIWESDDELDAFLADLSASRNASLA